MTPEMLTLARQFCEAVGMKYVDDRGYCVPNSPGEWHSHDWLYTGDGMLAVKAEMAKRGIFIRSCNGSFAGHGKAWATCFKENPTSLDDVCCGEGNADTEPEAVLKAAVAAMKGDKT